MTGHRSAVDTIISSSDGSRLLSYDSTGFDRSIRLWDVNTGTNMPEFYYEQSQQTFACNIFSIMHARLNHAKSSMLVFWRWHCNFKIEMDQALFYTRFVFYYSFPQQIRLVCVSFILFPIGKCLGAMTMDDAITSCQLSPDGSLVSLALPGWESVLTFHLRKHPVTQTTEFYGNPDRAENVYTVAE